ncbi:hypothetical protein N9L92_05625, partial [Saprospiraceae bacterium]|nr:hypothetical protein [Saprospiraceae bacterium]
ATHTSGDGTVEEIEETVTELVFNSVTNNIEYIDENGDTNTIDLGDLVSQVTDDNANANTHDIATHTSGDGTTTVIQETVTELTFDASTDEITYVDENGDINIVSLSGLISAQNDLNDGHLIGEHIAGDGTVTAIEETVTSISFNSTTNQIEYIDENGDTQAVDLGDLVSQVTDMNAGEHQIAEHVSGDGTTTAINETVTSISYDDANTRIVYIDEAGNPQNVDLSGLLSSANDLNDGHLIAEHVDGDGNVTPIEETVTVLDFNSTTNQIEYTDENGDVNPVDLGDLVSEVTDLNVGENQIAEHVSGDGTTTAINETITNITMVDNLITYTKEDGTTDVLDLSNYVSSATQDQTGHLIGTHVSADGTVTRYEETVTGITINGGLITYSKEDGTTDVLDLSGFVSEATQDNTGHLIGTHLSADGTLTRFEETVTALAYVDATTSIEYTDENGDVQTVSLAGLLSSANDLNDGHLIAQHVDANGVTTDIEETVTELGFNSTTNQIEYTDENGIVNPVDLGDLVSEVNDQNDGNLIATHVSGDGTSTSIEETITEISMVDNLITYTKEDGTTDVLDLSNYVSSATQDQTGHLIGTHVSADGTVTRYEETVTGISINGGTITYNKEDGTTDVLDLSGFVSEATQDNTGHLIGTHLSADGTLTRFEETVTALAYVDATTSIEYTDENGDVQNISLAGLLSSANDLNDGHLIAQHVDANGVTTDIEETVTELGFNSTTNQIEYIDENGTVNPVDLGDLVSEVTDMNAGENQIAEHVSGDGTTTAINETVTNITMVDNLITYTKEDGTTDV